MKASHLIACTVAALMLGFAMLLGSAAEAAPLQHVLTQHQAHTLMGSLLFGGFITNQANMQVFFKGIQTIYNNAFKGLTPVYQKVATVVPSTTKEEDYGWLGKWPRLREWLGDRQVQNLSAYNYSIKNKKYESTIAVPRDDLEDDTHGVYNPLFASMGEAAATHPDELVFTLLKNGTTTLCYDGQYFFDTDHPVNGASVANKDSGGANNYWYVLDGSKALKPLIFQKRREYALRSLVDLESDEVFKTDEFQFGIDVRCNVGFGFWQMAYASNQALDNAHYAAAEAAMLAFTDDHGRPLDVKPTIVVVGPSNLQAARDTFLVERLANGSSNPNFKAVEIVQVAWLP